MGIIVLAAIYKDFGFLQNAILDCTRHEDGDVVLSIKVWGTFQLEHVWIWERFPTEA